MSLGAVSTPSRGEVYWVDFNPVVGSEQGERRPCVIVSPDTANHVEGNNTVVVLPITSKGKANPLRIPIQGDVTGFALIQQIRVIDKKRLTLRNGKAGCVTPDELGQILDTLGNFFK
jgi:mRNA interferase MazF